METYFIETHDLTNSVSGFADPLQYYKDRLEVGNIKFVSTRKDRMSVWKGIGKKREQEEKDEVNVKIGGQKTVVSGVNGIRMDFVGMDTTGIALDTLTNLLNGIVKWGQTPFTIVSANYAHHLTACLCRNVLSSEAAKQKQKLVINIDGHVDYGLYKTINKKGGKCKCGTWGCTHVMHDWGKDITAIYFVLGPANKAANGAYYRNSCISGKAEQGYNKDTQSRARQDITSLCNLVGDKGVDVYVTVDMDVYNDCRTHYVAPKRHSMSDVDKWLEKIKTGLKNANYLGFDVTGLPKEGKNSEKEIGRINHLYKKFSKW